MPFDGLRSLAPLALAIVAALLIDRSTIRRGLQPPGFAGAAGAPGPDGLPPPAGAVGELAGRGVGDPGAAVRRVVALAVLAFVLWIGVFSPLGQIGAAPAFDPGRVDTPQLFLLHVLFAAALVIWYLLGFAGAGGPPAASAWIGQFGLRARSVLREIGIGAAVGVGAWMAVLTVLVGLGAILWMVGGEALLPQEAPPMVTWVAALPVAVRFAVSLSAGVVEEVFFRGFLQPRIGLGLSTAAFALAHLSYEQPLMLVGITLLSLIFGLLVRWRQSIWAAITAHAVFDAIQLLVVIPRLLELVRESGGGLAPIA